MEDRVVSLKSFNTGQKSRVDWQRGDDPGNNFVVEYRLFNACSNRTHRGPGEDERKGFHKWVVDTAANRQNRVMVNAPMPSYLSYKEGQPLKNILKCNPPTFRDGDIVIMTFRFGIFIGRKNWKPDIMPEEFIRVAKVEELQDGSYSSGLQWRIEDKTFDRLEANAIVSPVVADGMFFMSSVSLNFAF